jgi:hypothetical protein
MTGRFRRRPTTLPRLLARRVAANLTAAGVGLAAWSLVTTLGGGAALGGQVQTTQDAPGLDRATRLIERHRCWAGEAPTGAPTPAHAVVTPPGGSARVVPAEVGFGIWLDDDPGVLHAFCR